MSLAFLHHTIRATPRCQICAFVNSFDTGYCRYPCAIGIVTRTVAPAQPVPVVATTQDWTHHRLGYRKAFFGFDELHGFNRDSRSRRANRSNADALAYAINRLQASLMRNDPAARALVWGDMLNPWHNGARPQYQQWSGGVEGSSWRASQQLDKSVIHVPWVYNADPQADSPAVDC